jgi:hypothetical protein
MNAEEWLREQAASLPPVAGPPDGKDQILASTRTRTSQRRILRGALATIEAGVVLVAVIAVVATLGRSNVIPAATNSASPIPGASDDATAWINAPGARFQPTSKTAASCAIDDLKFESTQQGAYHGLATQQINVTNTSASPCKMDPPTMTANAKTLSEPIDTADFANKDIVIDPGSHGVILVGAPAGCMPEESEIADTLTLEIGNGEPAKLAGVYLPLTCGSPVLVLFEAEEALASDDPRSSLVASWTGPNAAAPGSTVSYVIKLANPTGKDIALDPCPSYTQHANGNEVSQTLLLNCTDASLIPAGGSVDYAMQLTLPSDSQSPEIKVGWHLEVASGTTTGSVISLK